MKYHQIQYFLKAAKAQSFSAAAQQAFISAQALTKQMDELEKTLGAKLFIRSTRGVRLTPFGEYVYERFAKIDQMIEESMHEIRLQAQDYRERINIGFFSDIPRQAVTGPIISFLLDTFQEYQMNISILSTEEGYRLINSGNLDLFLTHIHEEEIWSGFRCLSFERFPAKICVSGNHPWANKSEITRGDLEKETFLQLYVPESPFQSPKGTMFYANVPCRNRRQVRNAETMSLLLQQGIGFGIFPEKINGRDTSELCFFDYPGESIYYHTALVYRRENTTESLNRIINALQSKYALREVLSEGAFQN